MAIRQGMNGFRIHVSGYITGMPCPILILFGVIKTTKGGIFCKTNNIRKITGEGSACECDCEFPA